MLFFKKVQIFKRKHFLKVVFLSLFFLSLSLPVLAENFLSVVINEIAWMGTNASYNNEWIELYNNTDSSINLDGWTLKTADGTPEINLSGVIPAQSFYLLERTDNDTVPEISADQIYTGSLKNSGENLELYDNSESLIDSVNCSSGWFAGDNKTKQTMERINPLLESSPNNWTTSENPAGTPKAKNSKEPSAQTETVQSEPESELLPEKEPQFELQPIIYPSGIIINEIIPSPEGPDDLEEWIELKNLNNEKVNLYQWKIQDTTGSVTTYTFPEGIKIEPKSFLVLSRPTTKITLNNSGDALLLIQPNGNTLDKITYGKAPRGQSYNRIPTGQAVSSWAWSATPTPGSANIIPSIPKTEAIESGKKHAEEPAPSKELRETQKQLAAIGGQVPKSSNSIYTFLIALVIGIFSGIIILFLKKKLNKFR